MKKPKQKFFRGDIVKIAKDLGPSMAHFESDMDAIVLGSYFDQFGGTDTKSYSLMLLPDGEECSWYEEDQLTKVGHTTEEAIHGLKVKFRKLK